MKFSKKLLQSHIQETLPKDIDVQNHMNGKAFEVEEVDENSFEIKVLPNRAGDCLSHIGMAREMAAIMNLNLKKESENIFDISDSKFNTLESYNNLNIKIDKETKARNYTAFVVNDIKIANSNDYIKNILENLGQRSINNLVDITNIILNDLGQPMHVFDAEKVTGAINVRFAKEGEKFTALGGKSYVLSTKDVVIADDEKVLALAGVKGGIAAEVSANTKNVIFEVANFDPTFTRLSAQRHDLRTDASKRYENNVPIKYGKVDNVLYKYLYEYFADEMKVVGKISSGDFSEYDYKVGVNAYDVNKLLGTDFKDEDVVKLLEKININCELVNVQDKLKSLIQNPEIVKAKYKRGASVLREATKYFDCSSFTSYLYKECGVQIPRVSIDQYVFSEKISKEDLKFGDLIFANSNNGNIHTKSVEYKTGMLFEAGIDHVGMYIGDGKVIHASRKFEEKGEDSCVKIEDVDSSESFGENIVAYARVIKDLNIKNIVATSPKERHDIRIKEDLIEEVARLYGLDNITPSLPNLGDKKGLPHKRFFYETKIKNILFKNNFSEIITYSFRSSGDIKVLKAMAEDKNYLRTDLCAGVLESMEMNLKNMPLLEMSEIKIFEIGAVFTNDKESRMLCMSVDDGKKKSNFSQQISMILEEIKRELVLSEIEIHVKSSKPYCVEIDIDKMIETLPYPKERVLLDENISNKNTKYKIFSLMPYIVRDVAFWVDENMDISKIENIIKENAGEICVKVYKFDEFKKENKVSYGYRLIYQDMNKTLTDEEVNVFADNVYAKLKDTGCEIR